jgi:hypothetical protein
MLSTFNNYKTVQHAATHHNTQNMNQLRVTFPVKKTKSTICCPRKTASSTADGGSQLPSA